MLDRSEQISLEASDWLVRMREAPEDTELSDAFARWRDADPDHLQAWGEMQTLFDLLGQVDARYPEYLMPAFVSVSSNARHVRHRQGSRHIWRRAFGATALMAAAACLALLIGPELMLRMRADHITSAGQLESITLDDGSRVRLGPATAIAVSYSAGQRDIRLLKGQAWFEVHPDRNRPFRVQTDRISATALGTAFDVRIIGDDYSVAVGHGRVRFDLSDAQGKPAAILNAGDWAEQTPQRRVETGHQARDLAGIWQSGSVVIRGRTVADAIEELRPWYSGHIILAGAAIGAKQITGIYRLSNPDEALRALVQPHGGTITRITPWIIIIS